MSLTIGTQLGSHEITALLGKGGFGEVYRARDTKLKREVAIKILPDEFSRDPERVARFQREAEVLASLNHPEIAAIYDVAEANGSRFLVLELVEGETLAERIQRGPIPIDEALNIAKSICEALEAAHEKGIVHRDLKPANIKLTPAGRVKVLDFGLAKVRETQAATDISNSPTLIYGSTPGVILGTAVYMSPEQARGRTVDKPADIWAFGCVLYELLTGKQAFQSRNSDGAGTVQDILAAILEREPDWTQLPPTTPQSIRVLLRRCLQKDAKKRLRDAADVQIEIEEALNSPATPAPPPVAIPARRTWQRALPWAAFLIAGAIMAGLSVWMLKPTPAATSLTVSRAVIALAQGERLAGLGLPALALSPDGTQLVYVASDSTGTQRLYLRPMDALAGRPLAGTEGDTGPFFSPDGQWIGFFADSKLKRVQISGGTALTIDRFSSFAPGGSWGPDNNIVISPSTGSGLWQGPASGGPGHQLTVPKEGEFSHRWPEFLPGGKAILFTNTTSANPNDSQIAALRLDSGERKILVSGGTNGKYAPTGHLVYYRGGNLMAVPFDPARLEVTGTPALVLEGVMSSTLGGGAGQYSFSGIGSLVYAPGADSAPAELTLAWVDRKGVAQPLPAPPRPYTNPRLSPDGRLAAVLIGNDIWIYDLARNTLTRFTFEGRNANPSWTPDGKRVAYSSDRNGTQSIFWRLADGSGPEDRLFTGPGLPRPQGGFTPDGRNLMYTAQGDKTSTDLWVLPLEGDPETRKPRVFLQTAFTEVAGLVSPDGRWVAYRSNESGREEIYVRPFSGPGGKWQISTEGGIAPTWSSKGNELFYRTGPQSEKLMVVDVRTQPTFSASKPRLLFEAPRVAVFTLGLGGADYCVSPDGQRFLMVRAREQQQTAANQINVVFNWFEELKRRVPVKK